MCGISGQCHAPGIPVQRDLVQRSVERLAHRGPDGHGLWINLGGNAALGHTRLAIIDVSGGQQPLTNEDGTVAVTFNGEIYNHLELRKRLSCLGHQFRTNCDTEVLVHLYEEEGPAMVRRLQGMFAFAIWDDRRQQLFLARDRLGQKPLFFAKSAGSLAFASEPKALFPLIGGTPQLNPTAAYHYLTFQYVPGDLCAFEGVEKLQPGEWLQWSAGGCTRQRYWTAPKPRPSFQGSFEDAAVHLRELLREATRQRLMSEVPLGVLLSGGLDSSVVVGLMKEAGASTIRTFTASFAGDASDETPFARDVAQMHGTEHTDLRISAPPPELVSQVLDLYDEPFADTSSLATYLICQKAKEYVTVALTGDGGDESLLGYTRYQQFDHYLRQRRWLRPLMIGTGLRSLATRLCPNPHTRTWRRRLRTLTTLWDPPPEEIYLRWLAAFQEPLKSRLCRMPLLKAMRESRGSTVPDSDVEPSLRRVRDGIRERMHGDWICAAAAFDLQTYLPDAVLTKVDRASMAVGLECRSPFLDHRVVEFLATLPREWKLHPRHGSKWLLRYACRDLLPDSVSGRGKQGFGSPVGRWLRAPWRERMEEYCTPSGELSRWLEPAVVGELIDEHRAGSVDHTYRLWTLVCLKHVADKSLRVSRA